MAPEKKMIICIGEIVWDIFPDDKVLGGAPLNVAYHLSQLGLDINLLSRLGSDDLKDSTLLRIKEMGLPVQDLQQDDKLPTGRVIVSVDSANQPLFDIITPAAWDAIDAQQCCASNKHFHLIFGTLAQRSPQSREAIRSLWKKADMKFYDVNLRPPFTPPTTVLESLAVADVVKLNDSELCQVCQWSGITDKSQRHMAEQLLKKWDLYALTVSLGENGALLVCQDGFFQHPGFPVKVIDTVGAGDAFFASLIDGIISKKPWPECLEKANRRGSFVAGSKGATPKMNNFPFQISEND